jgi:RNA polymerase sigma-70 factor (ECF subfamily)
MGGRRARVSACARRRGACAPRRSQAVRCPATVPATLATVTDETLVRRTLTGDLDAFGALVDRHGAVVYRVAARIAGRADAEDVAQDALLRAFHGLGGFRGETPFRAWLLRITHNTALNHLERRRAEPVEEVPEEAGRLAAAAAERPPADALEERERRERLESKLLLLSPAHRTGLVLRDLEGLSYDEIAEVTESPLGSVKGRLHRARDELIEILRRNAYDWELPA